MAKFKVVIIWTTGEKEEHNAETTEQCRQIIDGYKMAFGSQIAWADYVALSISAAL